MSSVPGRQVVMWRDHLTQSRPSWCSTCSVAGGCWPSRFVTGWASQNMSGGESGKPPGTRSNRSVVDGGQSGWERIVLDDDVGVAVLVFGLILEAEDGESGFI